MAATSACAPFPTKVRRQVVAPGEVPIQLGTPARDNLTPMEASLACFARTLAATGRKPMVIGVGEIKDFTGRYSINEGNVVTQGGSLMLFSALGKMGGTVRIAERYDPSIAERELAYMDRRQLGNGQYQEVNGQRVPWLPYFGGTVQASDYYIVGGITEVNYNLSSGGAEAALDNIGFKGRTYSQSIAIDLRIVDSRSLVVMDAISLSKQFVGYEVGANSFRFFGIGLVNVNLGAKGQEPLQLGIRATIEEAAIRLVARISGIDPSACLALRTDEIQPQSAEAIFQKLAKQDALKASQRNLATDGKRPPALPPAPQPQAQPVAALVAPGPRPAQAPEAVAPKPSLAASPRLAAKPVAATEQSRTRPAAAQEKSTGAQPKPGLPPKQAPVPARPAAKPAQPPAAAPAKPATTRDATLQNPAASAAAATQAFSVAYELGNPNLSASAQAVIDRIATIVRQGGSVSISLLAPETEKLEPGQRNRLLEQRIASLILGLASRGIPASVSNLTWRPQATDSTIYREKPGVQLIAKMRVMR
ncbi:CsgG/HfaB family protein [Novosphingobium sp. TH158]|uniref:CsgG/HfaB family protein n=1 Tax=Novosphingobium sp. TH158 TaxID=2067455 RepID=UPI0020B16287|nr:CsgG/HfaB family protein [Novosphingobium sp. TH158]